MRARLHVPAVAAGACAALLTTAASAFAVPPPNDAVTAPGQFAPYTTANGQPVEQQAIAELAEATADPSVRRCLGDGSFARTVWYRIPEVPVAQELTIDASGRTLDPIDLAAFVQPEVVPPPPPAPVPAPRARAAQLTPGAVPNACAGLGDGGASEAEEPGSAVTLRVPANHPVLVQVGRRGTPGSADDERAVLSLFSRPVDLFARPPGDIAGAGVPAASSKRPTSVALGDATITGEDPAVPPCPSLGSVWSRLVPGNSIPRRISVDGGGVTTLAVFAGGTPAKREALDCVNRQGRGGLEMRVPARRGRTLWIRIGTDGLNAGTATLRVENAERGIVVDGGPGGVDPTPGGPAGGLPAACDSSRIEQARITGRRLVGSPRRYKVPRVRLRIAVSGARVCDAELKLYGPRGLLYAHGRAIQLKGRRSVALPRLRTLRRGRYRLHVTGVSRLGDRVKVRSSVRGRLR
jgi:hypothetical protein